MQSIKVKKKGFHTNRDNAEHKKFDEWEKDFRKSFSESENIVNKEFLKSLFEPKEGI